MFLFDAFDLTYEMPPMTEESVEGYAINKVHIMMNHLMDQQLLEHILI